MSLGNNIEKVTDDAIGTSCADVITFNAPPELPIRSMAVLPES